MNTLTIRGMLYEWISNERAKQDVKWGEQNHNNEKWLAILSEEVGEVAKEILESPDGNIGSGELVQVAAVCVAWLECLERGA